MIEKLCVLDDSIAKIFQDCAAFSNGFEVFIQPWGKQIIKKLNTHTKNFLR